MSITQTEIDKLLETLKTLLTQITQLRQQTDVIEKGLAEVQRDCEQKLSPLYKKTDDLEKVKRSLKYRLASQNQSTSKSLPPPTIEHKHEEDPKIEPPPDIIKDNSTKLPPPLTIDPRLERKRTLADHIEYFIADGDRHPIMEIINAVLADKQKDLGDMLELLSWGEIWTIRADWETPEDQYTRLKEWHQALPERLTYWQNNQNRLETSPFFGLWQEKRQRNSEDWQTFLTSLVKKQEQENARLTHEVTILEQQLQQREKEENNG